MTNTHSMFNTSSLVAAALCFAAFSAQAGGTHADNHGHSESTIGKPAKMSQGHQNHHGRHERRHALYTRKDQRAQGRRGAVYCEEQRQGQARNGAWHTPRNWQPITNKC